MSDLPRSHDGPRLWGKRELSGRPLDSSLAFGSHARHHKQSLAPPLPALGLSGHQISQALRTVKIAPEPTTTQLLLCQAGAPAWTLRDPWPRGWPSQYRPCQSWGKAMNGSLQAASGGAVSTGGATELRPRNGGGGVLNKTSHWESSGSSPCLQYIPLHPPPPSHPPCTRPAQTLCPPTNAATPQT